MDAIRDLQRRLDGSVAPWKEIELGTEIGADRFLIPSGLAEVDAALGGGLRRGALHE